MPERSTAPSSGFAAGVGFAFLAALIWGSQFPVAKSAFEHLDAYHSGVFRYAAPALVLLLLLVWIEGWRSLRLDPLARQASLAGVIGMCGSPALVFGGLMLTRPEVAAVIVAVQPSITALLEWRLRGRRPSGFAIGCIVVAFLGVITVMTRWNLDFIDSRSELIGDLMVFGGALCWVAYTMVAERFRSLSLLRFTTCVVGAGAIGNLLVAMSLTALGLIHTPAPEQWMAAKWELLFLAFPGVLFAMTLWNAGTLRIGPLNAMLFINLIPVVTFAIRYFQGYRFHWIELLGAAMVVGALVANNLVMRRRWLAAERIARAEANARSGPGSA